MRVGVTGATGFLGRRLVTALIGRGDDVIAFTRAPSRARALVPAGVEVVPLEEVGAAVMSRLDAMVNLAGEPVAAGRWNDARKAEIRRSRVETTRALVDAMAASSPRPGVLVSASGVGFYGACGDEDVDERTARGDDFLAGVCEAWEAEAERATELGVRVVLARIGVVLGESGGPLEKMLPAFKMFAGGSVGDGRQYLPWVHIDDVVGMMFLALDRSDVRGAMNVTGPEPARFREFARELGGALKRPSWFHVPGFALRAVVGEMADVLLTGQRALPRAAVAAGYEFRHATLREALRAAVAG